MLPLVYHKNVDKNEFWTPGALGEHPPLLQTLDHKEHAKKRKVIAPIVRSIFELRRSLYANSNQFPKLSTKSLLRLEPRIDMATKLFLEQIKERYAKPKRTGSLSRWVR